MDLSKHMATDGSSAQCRRSPVDDDARMPHPTRPSRPRLRCPASASPSAQSHAIIAADLSSTRTSISTAKPRDVLAQLPTHRPATIDRRTSLFRDAVSIVEAEYNSRLSIDDVAHRIATSRRQLQRAYAEIGNTTFREHLIAVRMERAAELLATTGLTIREVALRVGHRSSAHFSMLFRRYYGTSSSTFRHRTQRSDAAPVVAGAADAVDPWGTPSGSSSLQIRASSRLPPTGNPSQSALDMS